MASTGNFRVVFCALMLLLSSVVVAAPKLAISPVGYRIVQATPVAGTNNQFELTARAGVANSGSAAISVSAIITSKTPTVIVLDGNVQFGNVGPTSMQRPIISVDTFKLRVVAPQRPTLQNILQFAQTAINSLSWSVQCNGCGQNRPPIANAGSEKTAFVGVPVVVSGSSSSDPDGNPLTYRWTLLSRPQGSTATLGTAGAVETTLTPDEEGSYVLQLIVNDGIVDSAPSSMSVNTQNSAPIANAGQDQTAAIGSRVTLNGSDSTDANGDSLTYAWRLIDRPETSRTVFLNSDPVSPIADFIVDKPGQYVAELIVSDGTEDSAPDTVIISTSNSIPIANAGLDQTIARGATARLSGVDSFDADGDLLSYRWSLTAPAGSQAQLISANAADTGFHVDGPGTYVLQLIVSDGVADSLADTAVISTINSAPVANAGADLHVYVGETVVLDGLQSIDADDDALAFSWSLINRPVSSTAELVAADNPRATFTADVPGLYVAQLIVNDGRVDSVPDTSQIVIEVRPDTLAPAISVSAPVDGSYTHEASAIVAGQVSEPASLVVNGASVVLGGGNQFSVSVALVEGVNTVAL
ncbi:MAG TPA: PKD domain-containing protein, partial [Steroidobacteraceae bacterium]|nr:PKD domain-containing protein [Steroidobacteraceae bacterium]